MEKYFLLRGCCLRWVNPLGRLQELSSVGHPWAPGEQPISPSSLCPSLARCCIPAAEKSQNVLAGKAPTNIIKVQLLKGPVQAILAFCFPSGLCCSANPAQVSQLNHKAWQLCPGIAVQESGMGGHWSVSDAQPDTPVATVPQPGAAPPPGIPPQSCCSGCGMDRW